jgi:hypothetical protein
MELPNDIWSLILQKTKTIKNCEKKYAALPYQIKEELKSIYFAHKESLNFRIIFGFKNHFSIFYLI